MYYIFPVKKLHQRKVYVNGGLTPPPIGKRNFWMPPISNCFEDQFLHIRTNERICTEYFYVQIIELWDIFHQIHMGTKNSRSCEVFIDMSMFDFVHLKKKKNFNHEKSNENPSVYVFRRHFLLKIFSQNFMWMYCICQHGDKIVYHD